MVTVPPSAFTRVGVRSSGITTFGADLFCRAPRAGSFAGLWRSRGSCTGGRAGSSGCVVSGSSISFDGGAIFAVRVCGVSRTCVRGWDVLGAGSGLTVWEGAGSGVGRGSSGTGSGTGSGVGSVVDVEVEVSVVGGSGSWDGIAPEARAWDKPNPSTPTAATTPVAVIPVSRRRHRSSPLSLRDPPSIDANAPPERTKL